jgi:methylated-DNA-[protein]-cysteine S-methyltransferase
VGSPKLPRARAGREASAAARHHVDAAAAALLAYFAGTRRTFDDLTLAPEGSAFEHRVWEALRAIPFGRTESYGAIATRVGDPSAARAVGIANNRNPIGIVIPCHRVIGADGELVGYGGGLERKAWLLAHEGARTMNLFP